MLMGVEQAKMQSHYIYYLKGIKEMFLRKKWQMQMNVFFKSSAQKSGPVRFFGPKKKKLRPKPVQTFSKT